MAVKFNSLKSIKEEDEDRETLLMEPVTFNIPPLLTVVKEQKTPKKESSPSSSSLMTWAKSFAPSERKRRSLREERRKWLESREELLNSRPSGERDVTAANANTAFIRRDFERNHHLRLSLPPEVEFVNMARNNNVASFRRHKQPKSLKEELEEAERAERLQQRRQQQSIKEEEAKAAHEYESETDKSNEVDSGLCTASDDAATVVSTSSAHTHTNWMNDLKSIFNKQQQQLEKEKKVSAQEVNKKVSPAEEARKERISRMLSRHTFGRVKHFVAAKFDVAEPDYNKSFKSSKKKTSIATFPPSTPAPSAKCDKGELEWQIRVWMKPIKTRENPLSSELELLETDLIQFRHICSSTCSYQRDIKAIVKDKQSADIGKVLWYRFLGR